MKTFKEMWNIVTRTGLHHVLYTFIGYFFLFCFLIRFFDPNVHDVGDAIWFGFNVITTIGLGDITVSSIPGRILVVILGLYGIFIFALVPGVLTSWYLDQMEQKKKHVLQNTTTLKNLSREEKEALAKRAREVRKHAGH